MHSRRGSFLFLCIVMMALMVIIGFGLLRNIQTQSDASTNNQRVLLAQSAAQAGLEHATEQILRDYASTSSQVLTDRSGQMAMDGFRPITFLDGPYRAPFTAFNFPDRSDVDQNPPDADKDVRMEHPILRPYIPQNGYDMRWSWDGMTHLVGRARYYEPNYYNVSIASPLIPAAPDYYPSNSPAQTAGLPAPTSFVDMNAPKPERSDGIFYDEQLVRVANPDPVAARQAARYRLRYAVIDDDLSGNLLINPLSDPSLPQDYRTPAPWVSHAADAFATMMVTQDGCDSPDQIWDATKLEHVFLGRGYAGNVDVDSNGFPITFPRMYRNANGGDSNCHFQIYQMWSYANQLTQTLYQSTAVHGDVNGNEPLYVDNNDGNDPYTHALVGPQMSWWNEFYAANENNADGWRWINWNQTFFSTTPFGHALVQPTGYPAQYNPTTRKWYEGRVNTPFFVNVMTAPPWVIDAMLTAYLPPKFKTMSFTTINFYKWLSTDKNGNNTYDTPVTMSIDPFNPNNTFGLYGRDLLVDTTSPAFAEFQAPQREGGNIIYNGQVVKPDYYIPDPRLPGYAPSEAPYQRVYPGLAWNGNPSFPGQGSDDAGEKILTNNFGYGADVHIWQPFFRMDPYNPWYSAGWQQFQQVPPDFSSLTCTPPSWWTANGNDIAMKSTDPNPQKYTYSYWWDIYSAMCMAITVIRAQWQNTQSGYPFIPSSMFPSGQKDPSNYQTIRDLDRQFLAYLGESLDHPGSNDPTTMTAYTWFANPTTHAYQMIPWVPTENIRTLRNQDLLKSVDPTGNGGGMPSSARAAVMERVLNDFRMAFFGSSPEYSDYVDPITHLRDPSKDFRPLDFDGDGQVHCSCYQDTTARFQDPASPNNTGTVPRVNPSKAAVGGGLGPPIDPTMYFSPSGCFFMGKSHYYRVMTRGELWDNRLNQIVNEATLESVLAVDPEGTNPKSTQTLFQRWHFDRYQGLMPHVR
jgi:type II secretory pathway pseudopilin PulG